MDEHASIDTKVTALEEALRQEREAHDQTRDLLSAVQQDLDAARADLATARADLATALTAPPPSTSAPAVLGDAVTNASIAEAAIVWRRACRSAFSVEGDARLHLATVVDAVLATNPDRSV